MTPLTPNNWLVDFVFPGRLHRLAYFFRLMAANFGLVMLCVYGSSGVGDARYILAAIVALSIYTIFFIVRPRMRDIGMSLWWLILCFIPILCTAFGLILVFRAPNFRPLPAESV